MRASARRITLALACTPVLTAGALAQSPIILKTGGYMSPAATAQQAASCPTGLNYPTQFVWDPATTVPKPTAATAGTPRIDQYRAGKRIASYTTFTDQPGCTYKADGTDWSDPAPAAASGCGPFSRPHAWRLWAPADMFKIYPAVYNGIYNNPWFGPMADDQTDFNNGIFHTPDNVIVEGVVQNGVRPVIYLDVAAQYNTLYQAPVYFDDSTGLVFENIDIISAPTGSAWKAGIYDRSATNLTLRNIRVSGFEASLVNGIFSTDQTAGWLLLDQVELDHNGGNGSGGIAHNAYINNSALDPNFTVTLQHSYTHDAVYGHLFKTRAQIVNIVANYFQGGVPQSGQTQAETYLLDVPNGAQLTVRNNVFAKNASGLDSNGAAITFAVEGLVDARPLSIDIENNSFVAFSPLYDGSHSNYPFFFYYPAVVPGTSSWPTNVPYRIIKNAFAGYCPVAGADVQNYQGSLNTVEAFSELTESFQLLTKVDSDEALLKKTLTNYVPVVRTPAYGHQTQPKLTRHVPTIGAED